MILVISNSYAMVALSGKDGAMLWNYVPEVDGPGGPQPEGPSLPGPIRQASRPGWMIGKPEIADVDGDGTPDLVATMVFHEYPAEVQQRRGKRPTNMDPTFSRRIVQAVSGRSGRCLWTYAIDPKFTLIKTQYWDRPAALVRGKKLMSIAIIDGTEWTPLDPATGRPRPGPVELGSTPVRPVQYADLDGDDDPEILLLAEVPASRPAGPITGTVAKQYALTVFSSTDGEPRWTTTIRGPYEFPGRVGVTIDWPWLVDLDGDGRTELLFPDSGPLPPTAGYRGLKLLDGATWKPRWVRPMRPETKAEDGLNHVLESPDIDGDGVRELIAVSWFDGRNPPASFRDPRFEPGRLYVDALSGRDGHPLWSWHTDLPPNKINSLWTPRWWSRGPDGWPMLAVPVGGKDPEANNAGVHWSQFHPPTVNILEASTGRLLHEVHGLSQAAVADLDGDGLLDLWGEVEEQLQAFRGEPPEAWRALDRLHPAWNTNPQWGMSISLTAADLDGDGIPDTLGEGNYDPGDALRDSKGSRTAVARSGRDGQMLWKTVLDPPRFRLEPEHGRGYQLSAFPLPHGDLDGDGTPDVLVQKYTQDEAWIARRPATFPFQLLSGATVASSGRPGHCRWGSRPTDTRKSSGSIRESSNRNLRPICWSCTATHSWPQARSRSCKGTGHSRRNG